MQYVFGAVTRNGVTVENVKTVGAEHTDLSGNASVTREFKDAIYTDNFTVTEKYRSAEDEDGNCYDWYVIERHNRYVDKFTPARAEIEGGIADAQDATCELSEELDERIADIENALCELTEEE